MEQSKVKHLFEYKDGNLYWKNPTRITMKPGTIAGCINKYGYVQVGINHKYYRMHQLIYLYHHGHIPNFIDHVDGNKLNNHIKNLRECTVHQNNRNVKLVSSNTSGAKNVSWCKFKEKWRVSIRINNKHKSLGYFEDFELAELVAIEARNKYHGEFARHI
jgi:hypothetical protein